MSFSAEPYLDRLKPFQRETVDFVFDRLFGDDDPVDRFLVADEVGLGKTMIARGLVAKMIEHYQRTDPGRRIDVIYVCSNQAIAKQNYSKIAVVGQHRAAVTDRITKLPLHVSDLEEQLEDLGMAVNFIPITPTTSLDLRSNVGRVDERALLFHMLKDDRLLGRRARNKGAQRLLQTRIVGDRSWCWHKDAIRPEDIDPHLLERFADDLRAPTEDGMSLLEKFEEAASRFRWDGHWNDDRQRHHQIWLIGALRRQLAKSCVDALEPDLIILDEFQRFPKLLDPDQPVGQLAELLFDANDTKTLLLSATPYRMLTRAGEMGEDHHKDFVKTTKFLVEHDTVEVGAITDALNSYRSALRALDIEGIEAVQPARDVLRERLGRVMCRTERLAATHDRSGMLDPHPSDAIEPKLQAGDLHQFVELDAIAEQLKSHDIVEYWKSTPFPLNFMDAYKLAQDLEQAAERGELSALENGLNTQAVKRHRAVDLGNPRLRGLVDKLDAERAWELLWLPPSLPYYTAGRPFDRSTLKTKRLVFSAWTVVPKAIAALTSYAAERHLFEKGGRPKTQPLQWRADGSMTEIAAALPSWVLADLVDPKALADEFGEADALADRLRLLGFAERRVARALKPLPSPAGGTVDARWYAAAPLLLDGELAEEWLEHAYGGVDSAVWWNHQAALLELVEDPSGLGRRPDDLARVIALAAVAGPGTSALRSLRRIAPDEEPAALLSRAFDVGRAFRALFNLPEAVAAVQKLSETRFGDDVYWKAALDYCVHGNLQAVLDEYVHVLADWVEDRPLEEGGKVAAVVDTATESIGVHTADLGVRTINREGRLGERVTMRSRFALRLGDGRTEDEKSVQRVDTVRKAFNSPFWPFVLATTSIGQEGLDFHLYSHAVVHWNLPSNPVDLEQREGRVHRFKGHAVRRNLAASYREEGMAAAGDPWAAMFAAAPPKDEGLQPFWVFEGEAKIERHVLALPMSRDAQRLDELVRLLGIYRLAFGQPRQDELLAALQHKDDLDEYLDELLIDLRPRVTTAA